MNVDLAGFENYLTRRGRAENTVRQYLQEVRHPVDQVRSKKRAPKSRRVTKAAWRAYARFSKDVDLLEELSELKLPAPVRKREQVPLPREAFDAMRAALDNAKLSPAKKGVLGVIMNRGLRRGDVLRLQKTEIQEALKPQLLSFEAKGGRILRYGLTGAWRRYLELLLECFDEDAKAKQVWELLGKSELSAGHVVARALRRLARIAEIDIDAEDIRPHVLRRTYAVIAYEAFGHDLMKLKAHMAWESIETAAGYVDFVEREQLDEIAETMLK